MNALVALLLAWIVSQTGFALVEPPKIEFVSSARMNEMAFGPQTQQSKNLRGLYLQANSTVYLREDWNIDGLVDRAELVHELVHHFQNINSIKFECGPARERLAYKLQLAWLREQGVNDPYERIGINEMFIILFSRCRSSDEE